MEKFFCWLFLLVNVHPASSACHCPQGNNPTPPAGSPFSEFTSVNREMCLYYDGENEEWSEKILDEQPCKTVNESIQDFQKVINDVDNLMKSFNQTGEHDYTLIIKHSLKTKVAPVLSVVAVLLLVLVLIGCVGVVIWKKKKKKKKKNQSGKGGRSKMSSL
ncbi:hypothetical protein MHYP_G00262340 [Metynnis hypsauchen]